MKPALRARALRLTSAALLACALVVVVATNGCNQGGEGDRCNPDLAAGETDCGSGLTCTIPALCPEAYCCSTSGDSASPFCQPGCAGGQASICDAGGDANCASLDGGT